MALIRICDKCGKAIEGEYVELAKHVQLSHSPLLMPYSITLCLDCCEEHLTSVEALDKLLCIDYNR